MQYKELKPESQDHQFSLAKAFFSERPFLALKCLTLFSAGMGSGKSRLIAALPNIVTNVLTYVLTPNEQLNGQLKKVFEVHTTMKLIDGKSKDVIQQIQGAQRQRLPVVVFLSCLKKTGPVSMNPTTEQFKHLLNTFKDQQQLVLIDELDLHITELTGGINSKVSHYDGIMRSIGSIIEYQKDDCSLNVFDAIRAVNAKCIAFSGTFNNTICSKLPSLGYQGDQISIVNVLPIRSLYWNSVGAARLRIIHAPVTVKNGKQIEINKEVLYRFFEDVEGAAGKGLIACSTEKQIKSVQRLYRLKYDYKISCACITAASKPTEEEITEAKYIIGIKLVSTGLDLSTLAEGYEFSHGILLSNLSDKESNPLSKNLRHFLHMDTSASFLQLIARLRKGGTFTVPMAFRTVTSLGEALSQIANINRDGRNQIDMVGPIRDTQLGRYHQGLLLAVIQNLRNDMDNICEEERPVVEGILADLQEFDGRDLKREYAAYGGGSTFDHAYWVQTIGLLWSVYYDAHKEGILKELNTLEETKAKMIAAAKQRGLGRSRRGNGHREGREVDDRVTEEVIARAAKICCHCGDEVDAESGQVCHVDRADQGGSYTAENLLYGHRACDSNFDENNMICVPGGGFYLKKKQCGAYEPDMKQWSSISEANIKRRWKWTMRVLECGTSDELVTSLRNKGYLFYP